jgi:hypothetical protein
MRAACCVTMRTVSVRRPKLLERGSGGEQHGSGGSSLLAWMRQTPARKEHARSRTDLGSATKKEK